MKKNIVIIILSILVIGLSGYLFYDKVLVKDDLEDVQKNGDNQNNENVLQNEDNKKNEVRAVYNKDSKWFNYLKSANITSVKLSFWKFDSESETGISSNDVEFSKDEINTLFSYIGSGVLTNNYVGFAVGSSYDYLKIEYNNDKYVIFYYFSHIETNDKTLKEYLIQDVGVSEFGYDCYWDDDYYYDKYNK